MIRRYRNHKGLLLFTIYILVVGLMALSLLLASCAPAVTEGGLSEAAKHYNAGVEHQQQRRFGEAIAEYGEAIGFLNLELA